ncbi:unnamed protein product [Spirodela intermedia]|uniref:Uncharacterized protein n=2 Tax=Spirodela intermedia TaxID=51605 RepID=A0A7I8K216_SPIIN|nr:unnamed protein product [Spirodela intermedia]CAA6655679.1 unnamed protein product [Spirodela intermedia]CAA7391012.1 unnamed protein product [Spirodela intermedia]
MADRFFSNEMPEFVAEAEVEEAAAGGGTSLLKLLSLPFPSAADRFLRAGLDLKEKIVEKTWAGCGRRVRDFTLYTGALGTAFLLLKAYQVTNNRSDLRLCSEIVQACDAASQGSGYVTFICGRAGVCAIGAVAAKCAGDDAALNQYLRSFREINMPSDVPNELLYGRAGYLWACSFLNEHIGRETIPSPHTVGVARKIVKEGRDLARKIGSPCPLMYEWHGKKYCGAAHGLAGIMNALMTVELSPEDRESVRDTLFFLIRSRFPSGNYPSSDGSQSDRLVHWCHGAPGAALTLAGAHKVFEEGQFLRAAGDAAALVWRRGLLRRVGICHGVSGNAHVFLSLYRATGAAEHLYRARAFASFLLDRAGELMAAGEMHGGDRPYSLFEGQAGMAFLFLGMARPSESRFPGYEI